MQKRAKLIAGRAKPFNVAGLATLRRLERDGTLHRDDRALKMPAPPSGRGPHQLGLDMRTRNALEKACLLNVPDSIGALTLDEALALPGFGIRCLKNYLKAASCWNRKVEGAAVGATEVTRLRELLQRAWSGSDHAWKAEVLPALPAGLGLSELGLQVRTLRCLVLAGIGPLGQELRDFTVGELLAIRGFGATSLIDLIECLIQALVREPTAQSTTSNLKEEATVLAYRLERILADSVIHDDDPRFGKTLREMGFELSNEVVKWLRSDQDPAAEKVELIREFVRRVERATTITPEDEAVEVRRIALGSRHESLLRAYFGFGDRIVATLQEVAGEYGLTRERIRQVCTPSILRKKGATAYMPRLRAVLSFIEDRTPRRCTELESELWATGMVEKGTEIGEIVRYARSMGVQGLCELRYGIDRIVVNERDGRAAECLWKTAKHLAGLHGATTAQRVFSSAAEKIADLPSKTVISEILNLDSSLILLADSPSWYVSANGPNKNFRQRITRLLSVAGTLDVHEVRTALRRQYRNGMFVPPTIVLRAVLERTKGVRVVDETVSLTSPAEFERTARQPDEIYIVGLLKKHGGIAERRTLQAEAARCGIGNSRFWQVVMYSPLLRRVARGVYALVGFTVDPGAVAELQCMTIGISGGVVDRGWTQDGKAWVVYRLSSSSFETGIVGVPAAFRDLFGTKYQIMLNGEFTSAVLRIGDNSAWGFRRLVSDAGSEPGDCLGLVFDLAAETVEMEIGDDTLLDRLAGIEYE